MEEYILTTIKSYNTTAKEYAKNVSGICPTNELDKLISMSNGNKILDIGCGSGEAVKYLTSKGLKVCGIDLSKNLLYEARRISPQSKFIQMDLRNLSFQNNSFDGIVSIGAHLHISKKDLPNALNECHRVLKSNGTFYLSIKDGEGEIEKPDERYEGVKKFWSFFNPNEINNFLQDARFKVLENDSISYDDNYRKSNPWMNIFSKKL